MELTVSSRDPHKAARGRLEGAFNQRGSARQPRGGHVIPRGVLP